ncbi:hypothetical protein, partial [Nostoc sp.]|uniref:hypothetical protein n=1 Tax=Nostoc sp. TaxID=1180 RepID=UPI002FF69CF0
SLGVALRKNSSMPGFIIHNQKPHAPQPGAFGYGCVTKNYAINWHYILPSSQLWVRGASPLGRGCPPDLAGGIKWNQRCQNFPF